MNNERILRVTSGFLLAIGYSLHSFNCKTRRYRLSIFGVINFALLAIFYAICFNQHFEQSALLKLIADVSPFVCKLVRLQLLLGAKIFLYGVYEWRLILRVANGLAEISPKVFAKRFSRDEAFAYFLLFSTLFICFCFGLYIAIEMKFKLPPVDDILVSLALFIPHFMLAGALKVFTVGHWLMREKLQHLSWDLEQLCGVNKQPVAAAGADMEIAVVGASEQGNVSKDSLQLENTLRDYYEQLKLLATRQCFLNETLQKQLVLLMLLNANSLLAGIYSLVYFQESWYLLFSPSKKRIFYAANIGIYVFIFWDYLCLCLSQLLFTKEKTRFYGNLVQNLEHETKFSKEARPWLKKFRDVLARELNFKLLFNSQMSIWLFVLIQILTISLIAGIVAFHYLNDQMIALTTRLDANEADDK